MAGTGRSTTALMAGSVHPVHTVELLVAPRHCGYVRAINFDKFPDTGGLDPVAECRANIETIERSRPVAATLAGSGSDSWADPPSGPYRRGHDGRAAPLHRCLDRPSSIRKWRRGSTQDP